MAAARPTHPASWCDRSHSGPGLMLRRLVGVIVTVIVALGASAVPGRVPPTLGAEYTLESAASYEIKPEQILDVAGGRFENGDGTPEA